MYTRKWMCWLTKLVNEGECGEREREKDSKADEWAGEMEAPQEHPFH